MKSLEQMGKPPIQSKQEIVDDKEKMSKKPTSQESYNKTEWHKLKQGGAASAINKGKEMGVPQEKIDQLAQDVIARETENQNYGFIYRFRKNMEIGTEEEVKSAGEQAYRFFIESGDSGSAMSIAEDVYGKDSEEWKLADESNEAKREKTKKKRKKREKEIKDNERELYVSISKNATFADFFNAIDTIKEEEGLSELYLEEKLYDTFNTEIVEEVLAFRDEQASKATTTKILNFFKERGYSQSDVSTFLPIKFE